MIKFLSADQPGYVECKFYDASNKAHIVHEKIPVATQMEVNINSSFPIEGIIACEIIKVPVNAKGEKILTVDIAKPWRVETIEGKTQFDVLENQLTTFEE